MIIEKSLKIKFMQKCKCGAVTIRFNNGASNSMRQDIFEQLNLDTRDAERLPDSYCCDHCVNHWGIDVCECGSGEPIGECECGSQNAHDTLGVKFDSIGAIIKAFG